ncbi:unnamed protein product [Closterium sp. NIES-54]
MDTIWSSAKHEVATGLDFKLASGADPPCVSWVGEKLAWHTFPDQGSDADDVLAVMHIDLCRPFCVAAKDGSLYFLLLKDRKTRYVWVRLVAKKLDVLHEFVQCLAVAERQLKKSVLMLHSDRGGEFLGKQFTDFVDSKGIVHDLTCPYTSQQNGMAEWEMRTVVESVRTMLLHMVLSPQAAAKWEDEAKGQVGPTPRCVGREQGLGAPRHCRQPSGHHVRRGDLREHVAGGVEVGAWAGVGTDADHPIDGHLDGELPLLAEVGEPAAADVEDVPSPSPSPAPPAPPLMADLLGLTPASVRD